jgi:hypothetical protein
MGSNRKHYANGGLANPAKEEIPFSEQLEFDLDEKDIE